MIRLLTLAVLVGFATFRVNAQQPVDVCYEKNNAGIYTFYCQNNAYSPYTLIVDFTTLTGLRSSVSLPYHTVVRPGRNKLFRLKPQHNQPVSLHYTIKASKGCICPEINSSFVYLLPVKPGKMVNAVAMTDDHDPNAYSPEPKASQDWYSLAIKMKSGDTIFAARRGRISVVPDNAASPTRAINTNPIDNLVEISHQDCSFASYAIFRNKSIFVKPGQVVDAGTPLGIVGGESYIFGPHLRFSVYDYYQEQPTEASTLTALHHYRRNIPVHFWLKDAHLASELAPGISYLSEHPDAVIEQEMSNREVKNWQKKHAR